MPVQEYVLPAAISVEFGSFPDRTLYHILTGVNLGSSSFEADTAEAEPPKSAPATLLKQIDVSNTNIIGSVTNLVNAMQAKFRKMGDQNLRSYYSSKVNLVNAAGKVENPDIFRMSVNKLLKQIYYE